MYLIFSVFHLGFFDLVILLGITYKDFFQCLCENIIPYYLFWLFGIDLVQCLFLSLCWYLHSNF